MGNHSNGATQPKESIVDLSESERHRLLAVDRRRLALEILAGEPPPLDLKALATEVATREATGDTVDRQTVERVAITLHHAHLPELADAGVLAYDVETHRIEPDG